MEIKSRKNIPLSNGNKDCVLLLKRLIMVNRIKSTFLYLYSKINW